MTLQGTVTEVKRKKSSKMRILAIDPGATKSAYVIYKYDAIEGSGIVENNDLLHILQHDYRPGDFWDMAIEMIACYGMPVGREVFETCRWIGRFEQAWEDSATLVYRKEIKMHLCNTTKAKDGNVRQALIDRFPATGGGKIPQIGTKKHPGPLYGIKKDMWSALAVAVYYEDALNQMESDGSKKGISCNITR